MDIRAVHELIELNNRFYRDHATSFSATRSAPWEGWRRITDLSSQLVQATADSLHVLDLACGNMRFERFLSLELEGGDPVFETVDNCDALSCGSPAPARNIRHHRMDILARLLETPEGGLAPRLDPNGVIEAQCDLSVSFGFMHHIPGSELRHRVIAELAGHTRRDGLIAVSFWQFMNDPRLARKAQATLAATCEHAPWPGFDKSQLEAGDHLLGWQDDPSAYRYCHHFDESEIDEIVSSVAPLAQEVDRFSADGASHDLNRYLVLRRV